MKKEMDPRVAVAALAVAVAVVGWIAWRTFGPEPPPPDTPEVRAEAQRWVEAFKSQGRPPQKPQKPQ